MKILGKDGLLYIMLAICISIFLPICILISLPFVWLYSKITGKEF